MRILKKRKFYALYIFSDSDINDDFFIKEWSRGGGWRRAVSGRSSAAPPDGRNTAHQQKLSCKPCSL